MQQKYVNFHPSITVVRRKVMFSQASVCPRGGGFTLGYQPGQGWDNPPSQVRTGVTQGTPLARGGEPSDQVRTGVYPIPGRGRGNLGYPPGQDWGTPLYPPEIAQQSEHLLYGASCVHAGGLSCFLILCRFWEIFWKKFSIVLRTKLSVSTLTEEYSILTGS